MCFVHCEQTDTMPLKKKAKTAVQLDSADDNRTGLRIYCEKQGEQPLDLLCLLNNAFQGFIYSFGFSNMFPVGYGTPFADILYEDSGFDYTVFPFMVAHHFEEIGVEWWSEVFTNELQHMDAGLQDIDAFTRGYFPLTKDVAEVETKTLGATLQRVDEMKTSARVRVPYDLVLVQAEVVFHNTNPQRHYFVVRKFWHETEGIELWICLDSLNDVRPFVVDSIETFLFGDDGQNRICTNHLTAAANVSHVGDKIVIYGIKAAFLDITFDYVRRNFIELRHGHEEACDRCFWIFHVDDLEHR
jgi:hypothetical protein